MSKFYVGSPGDDEIVRRYFTGSKCVEEKHQQRTSTVHRPLYDKTLYDKTLHYKYYNHDFETHQSNINVIHQSEFNGRLKADQQLVPQQSFRDPRDWSYYQTSYQPPRPQPGWPHQKPCTVYVSPSSNRYFVQSSQESLSPIDNMEPSKHCVYQKIEQRLSDDRQCQVVQKTIVNNHYKRTPNNRPCDGSDGMKIYRGQFSYIAEENCPRKLDKPIESTYLEQKAHNFECPTAQPQPTTRAKLALEPPPATHGKPQTHSQSTRDYYGVPIRDTNSFSPQGVATSHTPQKEQTFRQAHSLHQNNTAHHENRLGGWSIPRSSHKLGYGNSVGEANIHHDALFNNDLQKSQPEDDTFPDRHSFNVGSRARTYSLRSRAPTFYPLPPPDQNKNGVNMINSWQKHQNLNQPPNKSNHSHVAHSSDKSTTSIQSAKQKGNASDSGANEKKTRRPKSAPLKVIKEPPPPPDKTEPKVDSSGDSSKGNLQAVSIDKTASNADKQSSKIPVAVKKIHTSTSMKPKPGASQTQVETPAAQLSDEKCGVESDSNRQKPSAEDSSTTQAQKNPTAKNSESAVVKISSSHHHSAGSTKAEPTETNRATKLGLVKTRKRVNNPTTTVVDIIKSELTRVESAQSTSWGLKFPFSRLADNHDMNAEDSSSEQSDDDKTVLDSKHAEEMEVCKVFLPSNWRSSTKTSDGKRERKPKKRFLSPKKSSRVVTRRFFIKSLGIFFIALVALFKNYPYKLVSKLYK